MKKNIFLTISILFCFFSLYIYSLFEKVEDTIYFIPGFHKNLFGVNKDGFFNIAKIIEEKGYKVIATDSYRNLKNAKYIVIFDIHKKNLKEIKRLPKKKLILFAWEPPVVIPMNHDKKYLNLFYKVYTFNDDLIDNKKYFKFHYPRAIPMIENLPSFEEKKLLCLISADKFFPHKNELYSERKKAIQYFEEYAEDEFDLYGIGWNKNEFKSYKGSIKDKAPIMKNYKFSICYENTKNINGYVTEKIFDSFQAGCIPIYLGAENITNYIPQNCFIDKKKFKSYNELYVFLKTMPKDQYLTYLKNINAFLNSEKAELFKGKNIVEKFKEALNLKEANL